jgi:flagellin-like hook-associated protein FlgL
MQDMRDLQKEVESLRQELNQVPKSLRSGGKRVVKEAEEAFQPATTNNGKETESDSTQTESNQTEQSTSDSSQTEREKSEKPSLPKAIDVPGDPE